MESFDLRNVYIPFELWGAVFCIFAAILVLGSRKENVRTGRVLVELLSANVLLLLTDVVNWANTGNSTLFAYYAVRTSEFLKIASMFAIVVIFAQFVYFSISETERKALKFYILFVKVLGCIGYVLLIMTPFNNFLYYFDSFNLYHENDGFLAVYGIIIVQLVIIVAMLVFNFEVIDDIYRRLIIVYAFMAIVSGIAQPLYRGVSIVNFAITIASMISFAIYEIDQSVLLTAKGIEVSRLRSDILLSQIKPHFIYNTLNTIKYLCYKDPEEAAATVDELADYLRFSTEHMDNSRLVPIGKVVENIRHYVDIEQHRFGDRLSVEYNIEDETIMLPPFVVQPILENAIKHGILKLEEGGHIVIRAWSTGKMSYIMVKDDGAGFDVKTAFNKTADNRRHLGIANVKSRVEELYGGKVTFNSVIGQGTSVTIALPKEITEDDR